MVKSCVQAYTGNGKGKTTAAVGLAVRAAGRGLSVKFAQFLKGRETGELFIFSKIDNIEVLRISDCKKFFNEMSPKEKERMREEAVNALPVIERWLDTADVIILDEAFPAIECGMLKTEELLHIIDNRGKAEIVLTGRGAPREILQRCSLVTEMREIKHYYNEGVGARRGIEY